MNPQQPVSGIALLCDTHGGVLEVLHDGLGLAAGVEPGRPFTQMIEPTGLGKALNFLTELRTHGAALDWELNVPIADTIATRYFSGVVADRNLLIVALLTSCGVPQLCLDLKRIKHPQAKTLHQAFLERNDAFQAQFEQSAVLYDELSRLNNELVNVQRELAKRNVQLERLNELKNKFLGMAVHDLLNPLTITLTFSRFLIEELSDHLSEEYVRCLSAIESSCEFMVNVVGTLLDVSAFESGKLKLVLRPTDLKALVEENVALNRILAEKKQIDLSFHADGRLPELLLDPAKIEQVLNNLIANAVKFSYPGTSVEIRLSGEEDCALMSIGDTGQGIPADEQDELFEWFGKTSVRATDGEKGAGLGLAIAKRIVSEHHGTIWVESEVGKGSVFYVSLPIQTDRTFDH